MENEQNGMGVVYRVVGYVDHGAGVIEVLRVPNMPQGVRSVYGERCEITHLSFKSRSRLMYVISTADVEFVSLITLTYGADYPVDGRRVKSHLNRFLVSYRRKFYGHYIWFLEFQRRGAPHFHMFSTVPPNAARRSLLARLWCSAIGLNSEGAGRVYTRLGDRKVIDIGEAVYRQNVRVGHWDSLRSVEGSIRYASKYCLKTYQKTVPRQYRNVGRFWGSSRNVPKKSYQDVYVWERESEAIDAIRAICPRLADFDYLPKYIFGAKNTLGSLG